MHLDLALVGVEQLQLLLQLHAQHLVLGLLGLVQPQLGTHARADTASGVIMWKS